METALDPTFLCARYQGPKTGFLSHCFLRAHPKVISRNTFLDSDQFVVIKSFQTEEDGYQKRA